MNLTRTLSAVSLFTVGLAACGGCSAHSNSAAATTGTGGTTASSGGLGGSTTSTAAAGGAVASSSAGTGGAGGAVPAFMPPTAPKVVDLVGPVVAKPKLQPIGFMGDASAPDLDKFLAELASTVWGEMTSEYGVGALTVLPTIVLPAPAAMTQDTDIQTMRARSSSSCNRRARS